ncbi:MAG: hypothetical protein H0T42_04910 [Deltaproteobacteria bacterium]|nr:hypothetical protein [Deltaproteobacteria bacterium]
MDMAKVSFYRKPTELLGGDHDRMMFRDICDDSGASPEQAAALIADIGLYAAGQTPACALRTLDDGNVDVLQWQIGETSHYTVWMARFDDAAIILGVLLHTNPQLDASDDEAIVDRYRQQRSEPAQRGLGWVDAMDEPTFHQLYVAASKKAPRRR